MSLARDTTGACRWCFNLTIRVQKGRIMFETAGKVGMVVERHEERGVESPHSTYVNTSITPYFLLDFHLEFQRSAPAGHNNAF